MSVETVGLGEKADGLWGGENSFFRKPFGSKPEAPPPPPAAPDPSSIMTDALNEQLNQELQIRRSRSAQTPGGQAGVTEAPTTLSAGQYLLGE